MEKLHGLLSNKHSSSVLKKKMLELKKEMCKHLAEDSFNADDADACSNV